MARVRVARRRARAGGDEVPGLAAGIALGQPQLAQGGQIIRDLIGQELRGRMAEEQFKRTMLKVAFQAEERSKAQYERDMRVIGARDAATNREHGVVLKKHAIDARATNPALLRLRNVSRGIPGIQGMSREEFAGVIPHTLPQLAAAAGIQLTPDLMAQFIEIENLDREGDYYEKRAAPPPPFDINLANTFEQAEYEALLEQGRGGEAETGRGFWNYVSGALREVGGWFKEGEGGERMRLRRSGRR